jgi:4-amino-4-deoxy-L-arabinose transferase-like glycosyltransferase
LACCNEQLAPFNLARVSSLESLDVVVFRFINGTLQNSFFDSIMPIFASNVWFWPIIIILGIAALWKGGTRGRLCVFLLVLVLPLGDAWLTNSIKNAVDRLRPCQALDGVHLLIGCGNSGSMPSAHASNWFAATMVAGIFFRRSLRFMLPLAITVAFSRVYNGVHFPGDVLAGAAIGAGYGAASLFGLEFIWQFAGRRWFPLWWQRLPSLLLRGAETPLSESQISNLKSQIDAHWLRLGYLLVAFVFVGRLVYIASDNIELSEDEAYQWLWSKHLALSYFSKPPLIAYVQWIGTHLFGDAEFGVRFFSPVCAAISGFLLLRFFARHASTRAGFWLVLIINVTPLLAVGSTLMTVDPLLVLFWTAAMLAGWRAVQVDGRTRDWFWVGLWMGFAFLSKYTALLQWLCWAVFFVLWKPARAHLRRPGPYAALLVNLLCAVPVIAWNAQNGWITAAHVGTDAKLSKPWRFDPSNILEFLGGTAGLLHPIFFVAMVWAAIAMWKRHGARTSCPPVVEQIEARGQDVRAPLLYYFFAMGAPVFLVHLLYTLHSSVLVNWIAAAVIPLFCLMVIFWENRYREGCIVVRRWLAVAALFGLAAVIFLHETDLAKKIAGHPLPSKADPLRRVRGWKEMARIVEREREKFSADGKSVFVIGGHYGTASVLSFYMPAARTNVTVAPLVFYRKMPRPNTQFFFWPSYAESRRGQNALYVQEKNAPEPAPRDIVKQFASVEEIGFFPVTYRGRALHHVQIFACRELR